MRICVSGPMEVAVESVAFLRTHFEEYPALVMPAGSEWKGCSWESLIATDPRLTGSALVDDLNPFGELQDVLFIAFGHPNRLAKLGMFPAKCFKIHFSLLPRYRGYHTSSLPILFDDLQSGTTLHLLDVGGYDTGDIVDQNSFYIPPHYNAGDVGRMHIEYGLKLFKRNINALIAGTYQLRPQPALGASFFSDSSFDPLDFKANFVSTANQVARSFRARIFDQKLTPLFCGRNIFQVEILSTTSTASPGTIVLDGNGVFEVATTDFNVRLHTLSGDTE